MKTYELTDLKIDNIWDYFVKYAQIKYIQKKFYPDCEIAIRNGVTSLCKVHKSKTGFTEKQFVEITGKVIGECPPYTVINGKIHTSLHYGILNNKNQIELVKELTARKATAEVLNCQRWNSGHNANDKKQIERATKALMRMNDSQIYKIV